jgi:hypothetical protein
MHSVSRTAVRMPAEVQQSVNKMARTALRPMHDRVHMMGAGVFERYPHLRV